MHRRGAGVTRDWFRQVQAGMEVLDVRGNQIGTARELAPDGRSFSVDTGSPGPAYRIPLSAVCEVRRRFIFLNLAKDQLS
jgi:hypothetical protein